MSQGSKVCKVSSYGLDRVQFLEKARTYLLVTTCIPALAFTQTLMQWYWENKTKQLATTQSSANRTIPPPPIYFHDAFNYAQGYYHSFCISCLKFLYINFYFQQTLKRSHVTSWILIAPVQLFTSCCRLMDQLIYKKCGPVTFWHHFSSCVKKK